MVALTFDNPHRKCGTQTGSESHRERTVKSPALRIFTGRRISRFRHDAGYMMRLDEVEE
jgi:hypothetical protein